MSTKQLAFISARAVALDQFQGWVDRIIFYPILLWSTIQFGWLACFLITVPIYFVFSLFIVTIHHRLMIERGIDVFGIHTLQDAARKTEPPQILKFSTLLYIFQRLKLMWVSSVERHKYRVTRHIVVGFFGMVYRKMLSWILVNKVLLYGVGTLVFLDPQYVFMYTQKCESGNDFVKKVVFKLFPMVCWHIFFWSGVAFSVASGAKHVLWLW